MREGLRKLTALIIMVVTLLTYGCPIEEHLAFQAAVPSSPSLWYMAYPADARRDPKLPEIPFTPRFSPEYFAHSLF